LGNFHPVKICAPSAHPSNLVGLVFTKILKKKYLLFEGDRSNMVRLRLRRIGAKKQPSYRVVAIDKEAPRDSRALEVLGHYNPRTQPETIELDEARIYHWLSVGAQPSDSVAILLKKMGTYERFERFKAGEEVEKLVEEYTNFEASRNVNPQTRRDDIAETKKKKASKAEAEA
jgi:small subunit ribosomal protein S16